MPYALIAQRLLWLGARAPGTLWCMTGRTLAVGHLED